MSTEPTQEILPRTSTAEYVRVYQCWV